MSIKGLDDALLKYWELGVTKTFDIPPDKGFGKKKF
jgi:FKBP-type peptidyl-prolyl cis-trans isomerase 2